MPAKINLINQKFGKLLVIEETKERKHNSIVWKCRCDCGNEVFYSTKDLRNDGIIQCPQCGKNREPIKRNINYIGQKINHFTILEKTDQKNSNGSYLYKCQCDCENKTIKLISLKDLKANEIVSCGCHRLLYKKGDIINNREIIDTNQNTSKNGKHYYTCKCLLCNRIYKATSSTLQQTISCGCQKSIGEFNILKILIQNNISFQKEYCFPKSLLRFDFALFDNKHQLIKLIEFDGEQHYLENIKNSGWNTYEKYNGTLKNDLKKNQLAKKYNIPLLRIPYWERDNVTLELLQSNKYLIE